MKINPQNMKWFVRFALIALLAGAADVLVMLYANRPYPWTIIFPASIPLFVVASIIIPKMRDEKS